MVVWRGEIQRRQCLFCVSPNKLKEEENAIENQSTKMNAPSYSGQSLCCDLGAGEYRYFDPF